MVQEVGKGLLKCFLAPQRILVVLYPVMTSAIVDHIFVVAHAWQEFSNNFETVNGNY